jgi:hypothetical protein
MIGRDRLVGEEEEEVEAYEPWSEEGGGQMKEQGEQKGRKCNNTGWRRLRFIPVVCCLLLKCIRV